MASSKRQKQVGEQIKRTLSAHLQREIDDPRLESVTIVDVRIDRELEVAKTYVSSYLGETARQEILKALEGASGFLRRLVGRDLRLKKTPEIRFLWDDVSERAERVEQLLASITIPPVDEDKTGKLDGGN